MEQQALDKQAEKTPLTKVNNKYKMLENFEGIHSENAKKIFQKWDEEELQNNRDNRKDKVENI